MSIVGLARFPVIQSRQTPMRKPTSLNRLLVATTVVLWAGAAAAQEDINRVGDGDFESGAVGLSLPDTPHFPLFAGGWASRGARAPEMVDDNPFEGNSSVRVLSAPGDQLDIIQDIPLGTSAFGMRFAFMVESGEQAVRLIDGWNRGNARSDAAFEARISSSGIAFSTPDGSWTADVAVERGSWHTLTVISDPRLGNHQVRLNGEPLMALPASTPLHPSTVMVGGGSGTFRYDAIEVMSLIDLELAAIRGIVGRLDISSRGAVLDRLSAAEMALARGSEILAMPELGVARNMLGAGALATEDARRALTDLIELIEVTSGDQRDGRPLSWF